jgi:ribosome-associated translation inhibitor RaiA
MEVIFHAHHAPMSDRMRRRARQGVAKLAERLGRPVDAVVRFEDDGPARRVEIMLHAPRRKPLVATATGRHAGPALTEALDRLESQVETLRRKRLARRTARA